MYCTEHLLQVIRYITFLVHLMFCLIEYFFRFDNLQNCSFLVSNYHSNYQFFLTSNSHRGFVLDQGWKRDDLLTRLGILNDGIIIVPGGNNASNSGDSWSKWRCFSIIFSISGRRGLKSTTKGKSVFFSSTLTERSSSLGMDLTFSKLALYVGQFIISVCQIFLIFFTTLSEAFISEAIS